jgi:hypothetical protein
MPKVLFGVLLGSLSAFVLTAAIIWLAPLLATVAIIWLVWKLFRQRPVLDDGLPPSHLYPMKPAQPDIEDVLELTEVYRPLLVQNISGARVDGQIH